MKRTKFLLVWAIVAADIFGICWLAGLAFLPVRVLEATEPFKILNENHEVEAGQLVIYRIDYCKYVNASSTTIKTIVGEQTTYPLATATSNVPKGCHVAENRNTIVPTGVAPGHYHLELNFNYRVNGLRSATVTLHSEDFTVVAPKAGSVPVTLAPAVVNDTYAVSQPTIQPSSSVSASTPTPISTPAPTQPPTSQGGPLERILRILN